MNDMKHRRLSKACSALALAAILFSSASAIAQTHSCGTGAKKDDKKGAAISQGSLSSQAGKSGQSATALTPQQELQRQQALLNQVQSKKEMQSLFQFLRQNPTQAQQQDQTQGQKQTQVKVAKNKNSKGNAQLKGTFTTTSPNGQDGFTAFGSSGQASGNTSANGSSSKAQGSFNFGLTGNGNSGGNAGGTTSGTIQAGGNGSGSANVQVSANGSATATGGSNVSAGGSARGGSRGGVNGNIRVTGNGSGVNGNVQASANVSGGGGVNGNVRVNGQLGTLRGQTPQLKAQVPKLGVSVQGQLPNGGGQLPNVQGQLPNVSANLPTLQLPNGPQIQLPQLPFPNLQLPQFPQMGNLPQLPFTQGQVPQVGGGTALPSGQLGQPVQYANLQPAQQQQQLTPQQRTAQNIAAQRLARQQAMQNALQQQPNNQNLQQQLQQYLPQGGGAFGTGNGGGGGGNAGGGGGGNNGGGNNGGGQSQGNQQGQNQNRQNNANILQDQVYKTTYMKEAAAKAKALMADPRKATDDQIQKTKFLAAERLAGLARQPKNSTPTAKASGQAQANQAGNSAADIAREQAVQAIDYCSRFMKNFTAEGGNKWNRFRDGVFVPIAILILLPGAVVCQVRAIISQGSPIVGQVSPIEGMQRGMIAVFLIPGSYLICNYAIDLGNSIQFTIADEYKRLFRTDMYEDAMCAEIRAFGARYLAENDSSLNTPDWDFTPRNPQGIFAKAEARIWGKLEDPCSGLHLVPANRDDASIESSNTAVRSLLNTTNAAMCTGWSILCAFQMAFFYYLFFVGPIMAALWVWPMKFLRDAFGSWVEGVVTLCFWSLFWSTTILLLACFKGTDDTGIFMVTAINFLATASVKYAFDFGGLVKAAGQKAAELADKAGDSK
ncbi:MAG: hypothetical protein K2Y39_07190 [Candidatus Obscuribacterales bacterium]|nr:hypothetical protein [Candidatus Obscuribacterales bacterium]